MGNEMNTFSERLKMLRTNGGLTQKQLADKLQISSGSIIAYEKATKVPSIDVCVKISTFFNVSMDWLCGLTDDVKNYEIRTNADAFRMVVALHEGAGLVCNEPEYSSRYERKQRMIRDWSVSFKNAHLNQVIGAWNKVKALYDSNTIDYEIYGLWIEKQLKDLSKEFAKKDDSGDDENCDSVLENEGANNANDPEAR